MIRSLLSRLRRAWRPPQWREIEHFDEQWKRRIKGLAYLLDQEKSVLDLGCGRMWLREFLPDGTRYFCCDYVARSPETIVCDFNRNEFPDLRVDVCFVSGCLEYVEDVDWFLGRIAQASDRLILSYCSTELVPGLPGRKSLAWKSHLSHDALLAKAEAAGFQLCARGEDIDGNEMLKFEKPSRQNPTGSQASK
ncbi:class I SAM-dependent methyltransferase [Geomonas propionica]|uniref:Class I SAM-dependent methyltransferase n=1 Tax=Geomonas propionica TaxID=2798582 RepID=A0ABS0YMR4_9BACT|nr:class I SAM-dependent methyltransferase [Geomonas propionica]MBJ6799249.1 class I SAM-dependent methyltransferase [Geomonas propionica]